MRERPYTEQDYSEDALMLYLDLMKGGKTKKAKRLFREALAEIKDDKVKGDLILAVGGANALFSGIRALRPYIGPEAQERTLRRLKKKE